MNKIVVITGTSSGIGKALKQRYQSDGDTVVEINKEGEFDNVTKFYADLSSEDLINIAFENIAKVYDRIDILVNCAGYAVFGATELVDTKKARNMFEVDYFAVVNCTKCALKLMKKGGKIFNISSACALFPVPFRGHYSAVKAGVLMLSYSLRMELTSFGIDVVCICPGDVKTNFSKNRDKTLTTNERYKDKIEKSSEQIEKREKKRMDVNYAVNKIYKVFKKKKHKPMYIIGTSMKLLYFVSKLVPFRLILYFTNKIMWQNVDKVNKIL